MEHLQTNNILYHLQHGFRNKRSCETQLLEFINNVAINMESGFAYPTLHGISGRTNRWIKSFLTERIQSVVLDGISSNSASVLSGVPQGSVLGPCLFLLYINDIVENLRGTVRLFADDTMTYMVVRSEKDARCFQRDLDTN